MVMVGGGEVEMISGECKACTLGLPERSTTPCLGRGLLFAFAAGVWEAADKSMSMLFCCKSICKSGLSTFFTSVTTKSAFLEWVTTMSSAGFALFRFMPDKGLDLIRGVWCRARLIVGMAWRFTL